MAKEATVQVRMDAGLKEQVEDLYKSLGTSFAEAVRIFAAQSVREKSMPIYVHISQEPPALPPQIKRIGAAKGEFIAPDDIDEYNSEILQMFHIE